MKKYKLFIWMDWVCTALKNFQKGLLKLKKNTANFDSKFKMLENLNNKIIVTQRSS